MDFKQRQVAVLAGNAKTASRRLVPTTDNLLEWLAPRRGGPKALVYLENAATISKRFFGIQPSAPDNLVAIPATA